MEAARSRNDVTGKNILLQISDRDCVAIEVRYHLTCFRSYTRFLSKPTNRLVSPCLIGHPYMYLVNILFSSKFVFLDMHYFEIFSEQTAKPYMPSFRAFCTNIIEERLIEGQEILRINKLMQLFVKCVEDTEAADASQYR